MATLELRDLRLVSAINEHNGVTRASAALNLTQSALSHQLADLERRLGVRLFERQGRRMVLTPAGERLCDAARPILGSVAAAEAEARGAASSREAILRMTTECYTCYHWLPSVIREYRLAYPTIEARIIASATRRAVHALLKGRVDLAIVSDPIRDRRLLITPLFEDEMVALVAPDHPWARRRFVEAADFADQHLVTYTMTRAESTLFQQVLIPAGVSPAEWSRIELTEAIVELVKAGLGVAALARWSVAPHLAAGTLKAVRLTESGLTRHWSAAIRRHRDTPEYLTAFIGLLQKNIVTRTGAELKLVTA